MQQNKIIAFVKNSPLLSLCPIENKQIQKINMSVKHRANTLLCNNKDTHFLNPSEIQ